MLKGLDNSFIYETAFNYVETTLYYIEPTFNYVKMTLYYVN